jgi:hypothetical protein
VSYREAASVFPENRYRRRLKDRTRILHIKPLVLKGLKDPRGLGFKCCKKQITWPLEAWNF